MGKSLTEVAKAVLMKESNDSAPDAGAKSMNPNMGTLRPGSRSMDPNPMTNTAQDLGPALVNNTDIPPSAKAAGVSKKDTSPSSQSRKGAVPAEKMMAEEEEIEESLMRIFEIKLLLFSTTLFTLKIEHFDESQISCHF